MTASIQELLQKEAQAVLNIPVTDAYEKAVELIVEQVHHKKGKLVTSGMGKAGQIAMNIATTFCSTGIPSVFLHPSEAQHGDLGILQENDLLLLISNSGKTREIVELTQLAHNLNPNLKFIVITGNPDSPLAQESDVCLSTGSPKEVCILGMTPTTSTTVMTVIGDIPAQHMVADLIIFMPFFLPFLRGKVGKGRQLEPHLFDEFQILAHDFIDFRTFHRKQLLYKFSPLVAMTSAYQAADSLGIRSQVR